MLLITTLIVLLEPVLNTFHSGSIGYEVFPVLARSKIGLLKLPRNAESLIVQTRCPVALIRKPTLILIVVLGSFAGIGYSGILFPRSSLSQGAVVSTWATELLPGEAVVLALS